MICAADVRIRVTHPVPTSLRHETGTAIWMRTAAEHGVAPSPTTRDALIVLSKAAMQQCPRHCLMGCIHRTCVPTGPRPSCVARVLCPCATLHLLPMQPSMPANLGNLLAVHPHAARVSR